MVAIFNDASIAVFFKNFAIEVDSLPLNLGEAKRSNGDCA
jgi:hypothetical protein